MCGATSQQTQLEAEQADFYKQATAEAGKAFSEQQALIKSLTDTYSPILKAGINQEGFSKDELTNLNATAIEGTAENYASAAKAVNEHLAAEQGDNPVEGGNSAVIKAMTANSAAAQESAEESQIKEADYATGRQNFLDATNAIAEASGQLNPTGYNNSATSAGSAAANTADQIAQENNSWISAALGAAGSIGGAVVSENPKGIFS